MSRRRVKHRSVAALPAPQVDIALPRHEIVDLALRQGASRLETDFFAFVRLAKECIDEGLWARFGFDGPAKYFEDRIGISYRSLTRRLSILEGIKRLPEAEQPDAEHALAELGSHKSGILARAFGRDGVDWRELVEFARRATEEAVQDRVSTETRAKPRGPASEPGEKFLAYVLQHVPPDEVDFTRAVFDGLMALADSGRRNPLAAFLILVRLGHAELAAHGKWKE